MEIAPDGVTYTCGPTGTSQAAEYAQVSLDGGDQFHLMGAPPRGQCGRAAHTGPNPKPTPTPGTIGDSPATPAGGSSGRFGGALGLALLPLALIALRRRRKLH